MKRFLSAIAFASTTLACAPDVTQPAEEFSQLKRHPLEHLSSGFFHTCGITDGDVFCFGDAGDSQIPDFDQGGKTDFVSYAGIAGMGLLKLGDAVEVAAGTTHSCARRASGQVVCWGSAQNGSLGGGVLPDPAPSAWPVTVVGLEDAKQLALDRSGAHGQTSCALTGDGRISCWGAVFGIPEQASEHATPVVLPGIEGAVQFGIGNAFGCALLADGRISCWGANFFGQLGDPALDSNAFVLAHVVPGIGPAASIAVGGEHVCAVLQTGKLVCWGRGDTGQLGDGFAGPLGGTHPHVTATPTEVALPQTLSGVTGVTASEQATCVILDGHQVRCWGSLGTQDGTVTTVPIAIQDLEAREVSVGVDFGCAIGTDGHTRCWGNNMNGQLGVDNADPHAQFFPTPVDLGI